MADCGDGGCSCRILAGEGITITGSGTLGNPYLVSSDFSGLASAFQVNDTPTVNLTIRGAGTPSDPLILSADSSVKLTELSDVDDPEGGPVAGESPVWIGSGATGHWEFSVPPPAPAGSVNVSSGILGTGAFADPIHVNLASYTAGSTSGLPVYVDTVGALRVTPPEAATVDWSTIQNKPNTFTPSAHVHAASDITNPQALSVGDSLKVQGHRLFVQPSAPTSGMSTDDLWFY